MDRFENTYLCSLLRSVICQDISLEPMSLSQEEFDALLKLARRHEVQPIAAYGLLLTGGLTVEQELQCRKLVYQIMMYQERMDQELRRTCELLETARIDYMPLKGAVIRSLYPEPWLRTSGDIDILVKDAKKAAEFLVKHGYQYRRESLHDILVESPCGIKIELHFQLIETDPQVNTVLERIWEYANPRQESCHYEMEPEMFYLYHIAHMAKHMVNGGCSCGIRFFVDLHLINRKVPMDKQKIEALLLASELATFEEQAKRLSQIWFEDRQQESLALELERFVLNGGIFESKENKLKLTRIRAGDSVRFLLLRIFWPYDQMKILYPVLRKHPILLPVCWCVRWIRLLLTRKKFHSALQEMALNKQVDQTSVSSAERLLRELELL